MSLNRYEEADLGSEERKRKLLRLAGAEAHGHDHVDHNHGGAESFRASGETHEGDIVRMYDRGVRHVPRVGLGFERLDEGDEAEGQFFAEEPRDQS